MVTGPSIVGLLLAAAPMKPAVQESPFAARARDWRNGAVVYQVFVDRFAPSANLEAKRDKYRSPQTLQPWSATPKAKFDEATKTYPHVYDFWGGDLPSLTGKLDYIESLGADVVYPLPIFQSPSNHKYDTGDYFKVDAHYGTSTDLDAFIREAHRRKMRVMLDGVFNHVGATSKLFSDPKRRDWFTFDEKLPNGYLGWAGVASLPRLRLENPAVRRYLWGNANSVVQHYLRRGIDGWRLDVAFEMGPDYLAELTRSAHKVVPGSAVVGEISGYASDWKGAVDGTFNFMPAALGRELVEGKIRGGHAGRMLADLVDDAGIESLLKSWLLTDNHDTSRFASTTPSAEDRDLIRTIQLTFPGSPCLYYGSELGMTGVGDPACRAPMRWDLVSSDNYDLQSTRRLLQLRRNLPALRFGDIRVLASDRLLAYVRTTDRVEESVLVAINPTDDVVEETMPIRIGRIMSWGILTDRLSKESTRAIEGLVRLKVPAKSAMILVPDAMSNNGYSPYDRIFDSEQRRNGG
jgi:glycosidase